jgi:hypothetical protein
MRVRVCMFEPGLELSLVKTFQTLCMVNQFAKAMKRQLHLIFLTFLLASMNACIMIANYQITAQESSEKTILASKYDEAVHFVIPQYYKLVIRCRGGSGIWLIGLFGGSCSEYRDFIGTQMYEGVFMALEEMPLGKPVEFTEHIRSLGLVCVVTVDEQINDDIRYSEILGAVTLSVIPAYATRKYVLSFSLLLDYRTVKEYKYQITEKAIFGWFSSLLYPVMYPFGGDIKINLIPEYGPRAAVVRETTKTFLLEAHRDGIL